MPTISVTPCHAKFSSLFAPFAGGVASWLVVFVSRGIRCLGGRCGRGSCPLWPGVSLRGMFWRLRRRRVPGVDVAPLRLLRCLVGAEGPAFRGVPPPPPPPFHRPVQK